MERERFLPAALPSKVFKGNASTKQIFDKCKLLRNKQNQKRERKYNAGFAKRAFCHQSETLKSCTIKLLML